MIDFDKLTIDEKRDYITAKLLEGEVIVEFIKVSGEKRIMPCTLLTSLIPHVPVVENKKEQKVSIEVIRVFCTDKQAWRSFRIESVISIT